MLLLSYTHALALLPGCATRVPPQGGPPDDTPPRLVASLPEAGALRVDATELRLAFSEDVNAATVQRALTIVPGFAEPLDVDVRRDEVRIRFPEPLRDSTTYVVTLGTDLQDLRNVNIAAPITLAFATGDRLDAGRITGTLRDPRTGEGVGDVNVFAYALPSRGDGDAAPDSLPDPRTTTPSYQTQTGVDGRFAFEYLRTGPFFVAAVADADRSRTADAGEAFAAPYAPATVAADSAEVPTLGLYLARRDTVGPALRSVRAASDRRFAVRFDERVRLASRDPDAWSITDTTTGAPATVQAVYQTPEAPQQVWLVTGPRPAAPHRARLTDSLAVVDSTGNAASGTAVFSPSSAADTLTARLAAFLPEGAERDTVRVLRPGALPAVRFTAAPDASLLARVQVDPPGYALADTSADGVTYRVVAEAPGPGGGITVTVPVADTSRAMTFVVPTPDDLGELAGVVLRDTLGADVPILVEAYPEEGAPYRTTVAADGAFLLAGLPEGAYRLRLVADRDGDGAWSGGLLAPYRAPEVLRLVPAPERVRPRWETVIDTLRFGDALPAPASDTEPEG